MNCTPLRKSSRAGVTITGSVSGILVFLYNVSVKWDIENE
jgi:hypothetical protein